MWLQTMRPDKHSEIGWNLSRRWFLSKDENDVALEELEEWAGR
jgi:hypothetical protein